VGHGYSNDALGRDRNALWRAVRPMASSENLWWYRQNKENEIRFSERVCETRDRHLSTKADLILSKNTGKPVWSARVSTFDANQANSFFEKATVIRPADAFDHKIEQDHWSRLLATRRDKALTASLNHVFELNAESFQLLPSNQLMVLFDEYSLPLDSQGDGTRAALRTMIVLSLMNDTLLMLEEPECHQHPGSLERFALALCKQAKAQNVQLIISTHSGECVRCFLEAAKKAESEGAVFHLTLEDGKQDARRLDPEAVESLTATGVDVRFLDLYA
jgi:predicted ATP-dependent endonuclease of OLD family